MKLIRYIGKPVLGHIVSFFNLVGVFLFRFVRQTRLMALNKLALVLFLNDTVSSFASCSLNPVSHAVYHRFTRLAGRHAENL